MTSKQEYHICLSKDQFCNHLCKVVTQSRTVFLVHGRHSYTACGADRIIAPFLKSLNISCFTFSDFSPNPRKEDVIKGQEEYNRNNADIIVAVGGGSAIDVAKLIRQRIIEGGREIPLVAIPTTAGSGAEATHFSVCYIDGVKQSMEGNRMTPDYALIYPPLTYNNNSYLTACTGFDAVAQAIESYWSVRSTLESQTWSQKAIAKLWGQLPRLIIDMKNSDLRNSIAEGAYYAGRAINLTTTTAPHAFSYKITTSYNLPHGHAVAATFPFFFAVNTFFHKFHLCTEEYEYTRRMKTLCEIIGCTASTRNDALLFMNDYILSIGLQGEIFSKYEANDIVSSVNEQRAANNPVEANEILKTELSQFLSGYRYL